MRKRTIISIILTFLFTVVVKSFWLHSHNGHYSFKFDIFLIILFLVFLFCYRLSNYLADFKINKNISRIDIIFLSVFFIFLFIPMSNINQDEISINENRILAKWRPLVTDKGINYSFGKDFEKWFNDRFALRGYMYDLNIFLKYNLNSIYTDDAVIINKKEKFCFSKGKNYQDIYLKSKLFNKNEINNIRNNILKLNRLCKKNNIQLYIMLDNMKESIYPEYYPKIYRKTGSVSRLEQVIEIINDMENVNFVTTKDEYMKVKDKYLLFMRSDTHNCRPRQSSKASYLEYLLLIKKIKENNKNLEILNLENFDTKNITESGCLIYKSSYLRNILKENIEIFSLKQINSKQILDKTYIVKQSQGEINRKINVNIFENSSVHNNLRVLIIGDSFTRRYHLMLAETFKHLTSVFSSTPLYVLTPEISKEIFKHKPDILVLQATEVHLGDLSILNNIIEYLEEIN